ncbi:MAG: hypothetical protein GEV06_17210 [Luteitalea sp.]|nr:hypothetical protein [Luteitalea sp.]
MAAFNIRAHDANRKRLDDRIDVLVRDLTSGQIVANERDKKGTSTVKIDGLTPRRVYSVQLFPLRHRPVGAVQQAPHEPRPANVHLFCPVHPGRVIEVTFPSYGALLHELSDVLDRSVLEAGGPSAGVGSSKGQGLYDGLEPIPKAGLLNVFTKMSNTVTGGRAMWSFVTDVYRVRGDRIFANVTKDFRDHVKSAVSAGDFSPVSDKLHTPPPGFASAGSFKHERFPAGVLQLTFFSSVNDLKFKLDADIDDAGGLGHVFQVLRHWRTDSETSPYDIHQILTFHQLLDPGYQLVT